MPVLVNPLENDPSVVIFRLIHPWTVEEWIAGLRTNSQIQESMLSAYTIFDLTDNRTIPHGFFSNLQSIRNNIHGQIRIRFVVGANRMLQTSVDVLGKVLPNVTRSLKFVGSIEEALQVIEKDRARMAAKEARQD